MEPKEKGYQKRSSFGKFGEILKLDGENKEGGDGWKEFKKGSPVRYFAQVINAFMWLTYLQAYIRTQYHS